MGLIKNLKNVFFANKSDPKIAHRQTLAKNKRANHRENSELTVENELTLTLFPWPQKKIELFQQLEDTYYQYFIGVNSLLDIELNSFELQVIESLESTLSNTQSLADDIPRLPDIIPRLIHLFRNNDFSWTQAAHLIAQDPVLLVGIIKIANSPAYNLQVESDQLEHILLQLGLLEVRKVMMKVALKPILSVDGGHFLKHSGSKIWVHSVKSAEACFILARLYNEEPFNAYLAGLIHNLGMAIVVQNMNKIEDFSAVPRSIKFQKKLLGLSKQLSVKVAQNWQVHADIISALDEQIHDGDRMQSFLGKILHEGSAVSMKHILVAEHRWSNEIDNSVPQDSGFSQAYQALDSVISH